MNEANECEGWEAITWECSIVGIPSTCPKCREPFKMPFKWEGDYREAWCCGMLFKLYEHRNRHDKLMLDYTIGLSFQNVSPARITRNY